MKKCNIVLTGMPSAGKSSLGRPLAAMLHMNFVDTDDLILKMEKRPLVDIVKTDGLDRFLKIQERVITSLNVENCVISTGGSVIYSEPAMKHLKKNGVTVYLEVPFEELESRMASGRRLARHEGQTFRELYDERVPLYKKYADITVNCSGKTVEELVKIISLLVKRYSSADDCIVSDGIKSC